MEDKCIKLRELRGLQDSVLALKNQMEDTYKQLKEVAMKEYKFSDATEQEKKVMNDINVILEEINEIWNSKIY